MARSVKITWDDGTVTGRLSGDGDLGVLFAHGAGAGQEHPFMTAVRDRLADRGHMVLTFDYAYMDAGRRSPDAPRRLLAVHHAAASWLGARTARVVFAGKSMGGRMGSHLAGGYDGPRGEWHDVITPAGLVFLGYPLVAAGKTEPRPVDHLERVNAPMLFVTGTRDRLCPLDLLDPIIERLAGAEGAVIEGGDHSFRVPKASGRAPGEVMDEIVVATDAFLQNL